MDKSMEQPSYWIHREFQEILSNPASLGPFSILLLMGPRQVGKSSLLLHCCEEESKYINLDDLATRTRAEQEPLIFADDFSIPLIIDEIQYAPRLLSGVKLLADKSKRIPKIWLTGSQSFEVIKGVQESLAGRVVILNLFGLSFAERKETAFISPEKFFKELVIGSFPVLRNFDVDIWSRFMSSYIKTYIERDVAELLGIQKRREFELFLKLCALRTGQLINYDALANDAGISPKTAKDWLGVLEDSFLIKIVPPYHSNKNKRLVKTPKLYFLDTGLCAYLSGWRDSEQIRLGPMSGALMETAIFGELVRYFSNRARDYQISFYRSRDGVEVDFLVEARGKIYPVEVKTGVVKSGDLAPLNKISESNWQVGSVISLSGLNRDVSSISNTWKLFGPDKLHDLFA